MAKKKNNLLNAKQVSKMFGVNRVTLWRWENKGILIPIRMGRTVRYKESDLIKVIR